MGHVVKTIEKDSPLQNRVSPGDVLVSINGKEILDVLDYKFHSYDERCEIVFRTPQGKSFTEKVEKEQGEDLGLSFETYLMDKARSCCNNCIFCFVDQMPKGMRKTLYFKDDDARLSFLMGNYITLTNLSEREVARIIDLKISPVNISVHTTNPELRAKMLKNPHAGATIEYMRRFAAAGISMNCQIVCCPGFNDGEELARSMRELSEMHPAVRSVSVVPVGVTKFREGLESLTAFCEASAKTAVLQVSEFAEDCLSKFGSRIFFCADELYLKAKLPFPEISAYEDFPQLENGVGMLRLLEDEFSAALKFADEADGVPFSIACGTAVAPFLKELLDAACAKFPGIKASVFPIVNDFFGHSIDVTGLITGGDFIAQLRGKDLGERLFISQSMLRREELDFLDDVTMQQAERELGVRVYPCECDGFALVDAMCGILPDIKKPQFLENAQDLEYYKYNQN